MIVTQKENYLLAATLTDLSKSNCLTVQVAGHTLVLFKYGDDVYAVDNRCPHMGFPLDRGTVHDGILTCHWHHARFDLATGGTFDQFADDVRAFPVLIDGDEIFVDVALRHDPMKHQQERLQVGLERDIPLVIAKSVLVLVDNNDSPLDAFRTGLIFGTRYRQGGWSQGLTMHVCFMRMLPYLDAEDRARAMYHGLSAVAGNTFGQPPRFPIHPLPDSRADVATLKNWFRQFVEVRDDEGAERCLASAIDAGADQRQVADMLFAAATDHRYITIGHVLDFTNKALEALDIVGWHDRGLVSQVLTSLVSNYTRASRMEESNSWRHPIDLVAMLESAFDMLPDMLQNPRLSTWKQPDDLIPVLLGDDPQAIVSTLLDALRDGASMQQIAGAVSYAAALRMAQYHTSNEFTDWDTTLHTFSFANAVQMGLRRVESVELLRGVFDAAMSVYLDRFLNIPAARIPESGSTSDNLLTLLDKQQQVNEAAQYVVGYLSANGEPQRLLAQLGKALLREDRDFHTIQTVEAAFTQYSLHRDDPAGVHILVAAARYLAAHAPTVRAERQTYQIAQRLHRGDSLFEGD